MSLKGAFEFVGFLEVLGPRLLVDIGLALGGSLLVWFWFLSRDSGRTLVVDDDLSLIAPRVSRRCPLNPSRGVVDRQRSPHGWQTVTSGQAINGIERIGGLSRLESVVERHGIDRGLEVLVHESLSDRVLDSSSVGSLVEVDLEPIPWYSRIVKPVFDVLFAWFGLLLLSPLVDLISMGIRPVPFCTVRRGRPSLAGSFQC